jgi:2-polyprenyl-3-methyl-5-hydroxy-6-metoxy-1,4-benzoquinol methylase
MKNAVAKEAQNQSQFDAYQNQGGVVLGPYTSHIWRSDPKKLLFLLARYKFCAQMLTGKKDVLEIGCGDSFGTAIVLQRVGHVHGIDFEPLVIEGNGDRLEYGTGASYEVLDITQKPLPRKFQGAFSLDVIEHIPKESERKFMANIVASLESDAVCVIGTPNISAAAHASPASAAGHVNLKSAEGLKELMADDFQNVLIFSMNDELVHTGFYPMAHYIFAVGVGLKRKAG